MGGITFYLFIGLTLPGAADVLYIRVKVQAFRDVLTSNTTFLRQLLRNMIAGPRT